MESEYKNAHCLFITWLLTDSEYGIMQYVDDKKEIQYVVNAIARHMVTPISGKKWISITIRAYNTGRNTIATSAAYFAAEAICDFVNYGYTSNVCISFCDNLFRSFVARTYANNDIVKKSQWNIAATNKINELLKNSK